MNNKKLIIILSTIVVVIICAIVCLVIFKKKDPKVPDKAPTPAQEEIEEVLEEVTLNITQKTYSASDKKTVSDFKDLIEDMDFTVKNTEDYDDEFELEAEIEDGVINVNNGYKSYTINTIKDPVNINVSVLTAADIFPIQLYVLTKDNKLYNVLIYEDNHATVNQYNISKIENFAVDDEVRLDDTETYRNYAIIKTTDGKYYTDYHFSVSEKYASDDTIKLVEIK